MLCNCFCALVVFTAWCNWFRLLSFLNQYWWYWWWNCLQHPPPKKKKKKTRTMQYSNVLTCCKMYSEPTLYLFPLNYILNLLLLLDSPLATWPWVCSYQLISWNEHVEKQHRTLRLVRVQELFSRCCLLKMSLVTEFPWFYSCKEVEVRGLTRIRRVMGVVLLGFLGQLIKRRASLRWKQAGRASYRCS